MIYYSVCALMQVGIRHILAISIPRDLGSYCDLLGDGSKSGIRLTYAEQPRPDELAQAVRIWKQFVFSDAAALILGDNEFFGTSIHDRLRVAARLASGVSVFACYVHGPKHYGVVEIEVAGKLTYIDENPKDIKIHLAVTGLYFYDNQVLGERAITSVNRWHLGQGKLRIEVLDHEGTWLNTGIPESPLQTSVLFEKIENQQQTRVACPKDVSYRCDYLDTHQPEKLGCELTGNSCRAHWFDIVQGAPPAASPLHFQYPLLPEGTNSS